MNGEYVVASDEEMADGDYVGVHLEGREIGVFKLDDEYYAYTSWCPHQGGPVCDGQISGTVDADFDADRLEQTLEWTDEGRILLCPWHHWEFDLVTGACKHDENVRLISHEVSLRDDDVVVSL